MKTPLPWQSQNGSIKEPFGCQRPATTAVNLTILSPKFKDFQLFGWANHHLTQLCFIGCTLSTTSGRIPLLISPVNSFHGLTTTWQSIESLIADWATPVEPCARLSPPLAPALTHKIPLLSFREQPGLSDGRNFFLFWRGIANTVNNKFLLTTFLLCRLHRIYCGIRFSIQGCQLVECGIFHKNSMNILGLIRFGIQRSSIAFQIQG